MSPREKSERENYYGQKTVVEALLSHYGLSQGAYILKIQAFKSERILEVFARADEGNWFKIQEYPFCNFSGTLGPKLREGDRQIPEGIYKVAVFNPKSKFYLSLGLDYPNDRDMKLADPTAPGSDIYIHGGCATVGCIPITDEKMAALYLLALKSKPDIEVLILPFRPTSLNLAKYTTEYPQWATFWQSLFAEVTIIVP